MSGHSGEPGAAATLPVADEPQPPPETVAEVWLDKEADVLEVHWVDEGVGQTVYQETDNPQVRERIDEGGNVLGFMLFGVSRIGETEVLETQLGVRGQTRLVTTKEAAKELGITRGRMRKLLLSGRAEGAMHIGRDWAIASPVRIAPGKRGPIGVAGPRSEPALNTAR